MTEEKTSPLSGKIDSAAALRVALKLISKDYNIIARWKYRELKRNIGTISDETFHLWRDDLRLYTDYWVKIYISNTTMPTEQDQALHLAKHGDQAFVAFAENEDKRKRDVFTRMRYGKFLTKFHPEIDNEEVKRLVAEFEYKYGTCPELRISERPEDFVHAIKDGPSDSCQADRFYSGNRFNFAGHEHPAVCYASGDIAVAWIEDSDGVVKARALINKEKKYHSRPYGDTGRIDQQLADLGYEKRRGALIGCRLEVIENQNGDGWLMPYVDAGIASGGRSLYAERDGDYWVLNDDDDGISTACGYENKGITTTDEGEEQEPEYGYCGHCGEALHNSDDYVHSEYHDSSYCTDCADRRWKYAIVDASSRGRYNYDYVNKHECTYIDCLNDYALDDIIDELVVVHDSATDEWIKLDDAVQCVYDEEYHHVDDCVEAGENSDGTIWLHKEDLEDKNLADKIYYDEAGKPFWYESDEIAEWVEEGTDLDKYALKAAVDAGQEALPISATPKVGACPRGTWQEVYRWMRSQGVAFDYKGEPLTCNFDERARPSDYCIRPNQPDVPNWREIFLEAQRCGVEFECGRGAGSSEWIQGEWLFNSELMSTYRIQEVTQEVTQEVVTTTETTDERIAA